MFDDVQPSSGTSSALSDYRARLSQALGLPQTEAEPTLPPRLGPPGQSEPSNPDDPFSTPDQGGGVQLASGPYGDQPDAPPPQQGQGPETDDGGTDVDQTPSPTDPQAMSLGSGGQGPSVAPGGGGTIDGSPSPTLDMVMPPPGVGAQGGGQMPNAPTAPNAPNMANAPNAPTAQRAPNAPNAPTINGQGAGGPNAEMSSDASKVSPANGHKNGEKTPGGQPGINVHPDDFDPSDPNNYKKGALADLQKTTDNPKPSEVFDALKPKKQTTYMDWWEQQHGDIEQRYAAMQQDLGARPDPQRDPSRKEKFQMLMDFGISLLQHSGTSSPYQMNNGVAATGDALRDSLDREQGRKQADTNRFDQQTSMIQQQKQNDLKDLGNYGNAVREDAMITNANTRTAYYNSKGNQPTRQNPNFRVDEHGNLMRYDSDSDTFKQMKDSNGNPVKQLVGTGSKGGAAHVSGMIQQINDMTAHGVPYETAVSTIYHVKPGQDPRKTYLSIYNSERKAGADEDEAATTASGLVNKLHGAGALDRASARDNSTMIPTSTPPASAVPPGKVVTFANGTRWRNNNGQVQQVQ